MSNVPTARAQLLEALNEIARGRASTGNLTRKFCAALTGFALETPDNFTCAERIEVGTVGADIGLKARGQPILLSKMAHATEGVPMPKGLESALPNITNAEWDAFTRMTTLLYVLLEHRSSSSEQQT